MCKIAVLFDCENIASSHIPFILKKLEQFGKVVLKQAFKDWSRQSDWGQRIIEQYGMLPIQVFQNKNFKNASDFSMQSSVYKILYDNIIDIICIVSSDSDFREVALEIQAKGKESIGFGEAKTPISLQNAYSHFICIPDVCKNTRRKVIATENNELTILKHAIQTIKNKEGFCHVAQLSNYLQSQNPHYTLKEYFKTKRWVNVFKRYPKDLQYEYIGNNNRTLIVRIIKKQ